MLRAIKIRIKDKPENALKVRKFSVPLLYNNKIFNT